MSATKCSRPCTITCPSLLILLLGEVGAGRYLIYRRILQYSSFRILLCTDMLYSVLPGSDQFGTVAKSHLVQYFGYVFSACNIQHSSPQDTININESSTYLAGAYVIWTRWGGARLQSTVARVLWSDPDSDSDLT